MIFCFSHRKSRVRGCNRGAAHALCGGKVLRDYSVRRSAARSSREDVPSRTQNCFTATPFAIIFSTQIPDANWKNLNLVCDAVNDRVEWDEALTGLAKRCVTSTVTLVVQQTAAILALICQDRFATGFDAIGCRKTRR